MKKLEAKKIKKLKILTQKEMKFIYGGGSGGTTKNPPPIIP